MSMTVHQTLFFTEHTEQIRIKLHDTIQGLLLIGLGLVTVVPGGRQFIWGNISGEPLLHVEHLLVAWFLISGNDDLDIVTVPSSVWS